MKKIIKVLVLHIALSAFFISNALAYECGETFTVNTYTDVSDACSCSSVDNKATPIYADQNRIKYCCGWKDGNDCYVSNPDNETAYCGDTYPTDTRNCTCSAGSPTIMADGTTTCCGWYDSESDSCKSSDVGINDIEVSANTLNSLNPLSNSSTDADLSTPGGIISRALGSFIFPIAGLILFITLLLGGFQMLTGATSKGMEEGKQRITSAIIGFIILFAAYWIAQLLEMIFGIRILS